MYGVKLRELKLSIQKHTKEVVQGKVLIGQVTKSEVL